MPTRTNVLRNRVAQRPPITGGTTAPGPATNRGPRVAQRRPLSGQIGGHKALPAPKPSPGATGAAQQAAPAPMPWDSQFELASGSAEKSYADQLAYLGSKRTMAQQAFGLDQGFNDYAANPYSRAALLRKSYDNTVRGTTNSLAAQGQLYAGSLHNMQGANRSGYDLSYDELNKEYLASLGDIDRETAEIREARDNAILEAGWRRLEAQGNEPLEPQTAPAPGRKPKPKPKPKHPSVNTQVKQRRAVTKGRR